MTARQVLWSLWVQKHRVLGFLSNQVLAQILGVSVGFLILRLLSIEDYATYALFGAFVASANVTSDLGTAAVLSTLLSREGSARRDDLIAQARQIRYILTALSALGFAVIFLGTTKTQGLERVGVLLALVAVIALQAKSAQDRFILASGQRLGIINRADPFVALFRLALVGGSLFLFERTGVLLPITAWLLSAALLAIWLHINIPTVAPLPWRLRQNAIVPLIVPLLLGNFYYLIAGLIPVLSLDSLGSPEDVAEYWALNRLGMIYAALIPAVSIIAHPFVSRGLDGNFSARSGTVICLVLLFTGAVTASGMFVPEAWLLLLGDQYAHLRFFVPVMLLVSSLHVLTSTIYTMILASGETGRHHLAVGAAFAAQAGAYFFHPIDDLISAFTFLIIVELVRLLAHFAIYWRSARILHYRSRQEGQA